MLKTQTGRQKIIIVGGNAAGPAAAAKAKRLSPNSTVKLYEAGKFISTGTCELPYVLSKIIHDYKNIVYFDEKSFFLKKGVEVYTKHFVEKIDRKNKKITIVNIIDGKRFEENYDKLILTTGSKPKEIPNLSVSLVNVFHLKSVKELIDIQSYLSLNDVKKVLILGAGYIGLEAAESFIKLGKEVTILELAGLPFPGAEPEIQNLILNVLNKTGVKFLGNSKNTMFQTNSERLKGIKYKGRFITFDMAVVAAGFVPNNDLALSTKLKTGDFGGLRVDTKLKTSDPNIFAAGDNIEVPNKITGKFDYLPIATLAHEHGHIAGENAVGGNMHIHPVIKNTAVKIFSNVYASVGLNFEQARNYSIHSDFVYGFANNIVPVMPDSKKVFGKIIFDTEKKIILGASFLGGREVTGYADLISAFIHEKIDARVLHKLNFNYTPPSSPFINLLSVLGRKIKDKIK